MSLVLRHRPARLHPALLPAFVALVVVFLAGFPEAAQPAARKHTPRQARPASRLAPALQRTIAHELAPGRPYASRTSARQLERRRELEKDALPTRQAFTEGAVSTFSTQPGLAADALVNSRAVLTCASCQNLPIAQDEASVAVHGNFVVASFNDMRSRCGLLTRQNFGYSSDGGATFTDGNGIPKAANGGNIWGDPSVAVNHRTGEFYLAGLYGTPSGVGASRGHFSGGGFVFDAIAPAAASAPGDFYDKPWMTVDSTSGIVYMTWTNFAANGNNYLQLVRLDSALNPLGPAQTLNDTTIGCGVQFSHMAVGPDGVLYVIWQQYYCDEPRMDNPLTVMIRRSDDFGVTFGPPVSVSPPHPINTACGAPGFLRWFASIQPTIAVDNSHGPHRGRVYVAWDQALDYLSAPLLDTTTRFEAEPNGTSATANVLVPGGKLRGTKNNVEDDWFRIDMNAGETYYQTSVINWAVMYDSTREDVGAQIYAPDLSGVLHLAANGSGTSSSMLYTAPRTGSYYLRLYGTLTGVSSYTFYTALVPATPPSALARDVRDQLMAWSDDGLLWSEPVRMNDSPPGADAQYPSIGVDGRGRVYCAWMDWRDDHESGTASTQYLAASGDGGVTWGPNQRLGDAVTGWGTNVCISNGNNQGDYQVLSTDGDRVVTAFTDARLGDPDIFVDASVFAEALSAPAAFTAGAGHDTTYEAQVLNQGNFARQLDWRLEDDAGWLTGTTSGTPTLAAGATLPVVVPLHPAGQPGDSSQVRLILSDAAIPGYADTAVTMVRLGGTAGVPVPGALALFLAPPAPNPSRGELQLRFGTASGGRVRLTVFSIDGARVRSLLDQPLAPGPHAVRWDGRDARGRAVPAGSYLVRLNADRQNLVRRVVVAP